jgi:CBS domain-containing protein
LLTAPKQLLEYSALIVMGSEGREEQILKTDQDNALILSDNLQIDKEDLESFTISFTETLISFGYPKCDGNIMISNPKWVMSESDFQKKISYWVDLQNSDGFMNLAIIYDAMSVAGDSRLLENIKGYLLKHIEPSNVFFSHFARASLSFETPLGLFSDFVSDENGLDIKKGGLFAIVHGVRSLSIEHKILETNTVIRLKKLNDLGVIDRELSGDLIESFTFFLNLRLSSNLNHLGRGEDTSNYIDPKKLSKIEKDLLKDALKIVDQFKKFLTYHYKLNLLG